MSDDVVLLQQTITRGEEISEEVIERVGDRRAMALITAALAEAARRRFTSAPLDAIKQFADGLPDRFPSAAPDFKTLHAELLIRAALTGDPALIESITADQILSLCFLLVYAIMSEENLDPMAEKTYINGVIAEANTYSE